MKVYFAAYSTNSNGDIENFEIREMEQEFAERPFFSSEQGCVDFYIKQFSEVVKIFEKDIEYLKIRADKLRKTIENLNIERIENKQ